MDSIANRDLRFAFATGMRGALLDGYDRFFEFDHCIINQFFSVDTMYPVI
jgi:hypothetical protein